MPIYTQDELRSTARSSWVEVVDWTHHFLERIRRDPIPTGKGAAHWGKASDAPRPSEIQVEPRARRDRIVVTSGDVIVESACGRFRMSKRDYFDLPPDGAKVLNIGYSSADFVHISGTWNETVRTEICAFGPEFPCDYHYHDGHEYWMPYQGHFTLQYDGRDFPMKPGLLLAARRGHEHGVSAPAEEFRAVVLATGLAEPYRDGHLSRARHGDPLPEGDEG
jgi:quercetin dioxygenase-like cupin family protein